MNINNNDSKRSALQLLQEIDSGITNPKLLDKQSRQQCVELLIIEGYTHAQISQVLRCSPKTVHRDAKEIRESNQLTPNIEFAKQFIGEVLQKGMNHHSSLVRIARSKNISSGEKIQAEYIAWKVFKEITETLQSLGYLPLKPKEVTGELFHHIGNNEGGESIDEARNMLIEIESVAKDTDTYTPELRKKLKALNSRIDEVEVVSEVKELKNDQQKEIVNKEDNKNEK